MQMRFETIVTRQDGPSFTVTLNRPGRRNAIGLAMMDEIEAAAAQARADDSIRTLIITGGQECFSAGVDLNDVLPVRSPQQCADFFGRLHRLNATLEGLPKPVIAAIEGFCFTGGCEMALACDIRIAGESASFAITSARIGTIPGAGATVRLPRIVGIAKALELMFSAKPIDAIEAGRIGLINRVTRTGEALEAARTLAAIYESCAPLSHALIKRAVRDGMQTDFSSALKLETALATEIYGTQDKQEGISAFLEKRAPVFKGR
ncbi:MAG TPA: enoyl-CoA hydratase-related protein [Candidatus Binataceae bacterium]|nr:enoyl-CoA hydratase-related protein [Candidatus Binataceae bacterium]